MINPIIVKGKYNEALVYAKVLESSSENKIRQYLDRPEFAGTVVRVMPDVHLGKSTVIGWTATYNNIIMPSVIGLDIGCGVCACNLGKGKLPFDKLDSFIKKNIPSGQNVRSETYYDIPGINAFISETLGASPDFTQLETAITNACCKYEHSSDRVLSSIGTLGGGNHFIEIDLDEKNNRWLLIHSGSRIFGAWTAEYYENIALQETEQDTPIKYLSGSSLDNYLHDVSLAQHYAKLNRAVMAKIITGFFKTDLQSIEYIDCVHNYVDTVRSIIRKGAISAEAGERVVIPFSMSEGAVIGFGKGNTDWNKSAPHGAGRKRTRTDARALSLDEYRKEMRGVWSSVICKNTLEESPMAYRKAKDMLDIISETADIEHRLKPVYNFKAVD